MFMFKPPPLPVVTKSDLRRHHHDAPAPLTHSRYALHDAAGDWALRIWCGVLVPPVESIRERITDESHGKGK